jgi:hypothetical protein
MSRSPRPVTRLSAPTADVRLVSVHVDQLARWRRALPETTQSDPLVEGQGEEQHDDRSDPNTSDAHRPSPQRCGPSRL